MSQTATGTTGSHSMLGNAGMDNKSAVFVATCVAAAASTPLMALYADYPIALACACSASCRSRR